MEEGGGAFFFHFRQSPDFFYGILAEDSEVNLENDKENLVSHTAGSPHSASNQGQRQPAVLHLCLFISTRHLK